MAAVPLAADPSGPPLEVLYEDEHFIAVNKPPGLHTAPIHRFKGTSYNLCILPHFGICVRYRTLVKSRTQHTAHRNLAKHVSRSYFRCS